MFEHNLKIPRARESKEISLARSDMCTCIRSVILKSMARKPVTVAAGGGLDGGAAAAAVAAAATEAAAGTCLTTV